MTMTEYNLGTQPLDELLTRLNLQNHDLVHRSTEQLTHKMVQKGRRGRRLTPNVQRKIFNALNACLPDQNTRLTMSDLFNY